MPWIKGKFYMNPLYGRALERARSADQETNAHWVTIDGRHVLIQEQNHDQLKASGKTSARNRQNQRVARIIYNETSGLRPVNRNTDDLHDARVAMAHAIFNGSSTKHPPTTVTDALRPSAVKAIRTDPTAKAAWMDAQAAVREAAAAADDTQRAIHFLLDFPGLNRPNWATDDRETANYGPFSNAAGGGDVKRRALVTVRIYAERPRY